MAGMTFARHDSCCQFLPGAGCRRFILGCIYLPTRRMDGGCRENIPLPKGKGWSSSEEPKERSGLGQVEFEPADRSVFLQPEHGGSCNTDQINAVRALCLQNKLIPWFTESTLLWCRQLLSCFSRDGNQDSGAASGIRVLPFQSLSEMLKAGMSHLLKIRIQSGVAGDTHREPWRLFCNHVPAK